MTTLTSLSTVALKLAPSVYAYPIIQTWFGLALVDICLTHAVCEPEYTVTPGRTRSIDTRATVLTDNRTNITLVNVCLTRVTFPTFTI